MIELNGLITWQESVEAAQDLTTVKSPGLNGISLEAHENLDKINLIFLFEFATNFWNDGCDFEEWHEGQLAPLPKSEDSSDLRKWRGINLMDMVDKIFSSMLTEMLNALIKKICAR